MARMRERIFAGSGAVLFFGLAIVGTVYAVMQGGGDSSTDTSQAAQTCTTTQTEQALPVPEVYKPEGTVSELQKTDLEAGTGAAAKAGDCLVVKYYGTLASDGTKFDEDFTDTTAFAFKLGEGQVISGWDQGLVGMKVGGTRRLVLPAALGYGANAQGSIPANSDLVFVVKLLRIQS
jgi:FKBP-type peptidyl-prolyl cis-trans isomerase